MIADGGTELPSTKGNAMRSILLGTTMVLAALNGFAQGASVVLSWPASSGAFLLQSADTPSSGSWNPVALEVVTNGLIATVTVAPTNTQAY